MWLDHENFYELKRKEVIHNFLNDESLDKVLQVQIKQIYEGGWVWKRRY
jgi:hypothetical protein